MPIERVEPELAERARKLIDDHLPTQGLSSIVVVSRQTVDRLQQAIADALYDMRESHGKTSA